MTEQRKTEQLDLDGLGQLSFGTESPVLEVSGLTEASRRESDLQLWSEQPKLTPPDPLLLSCIQRLDQVETSLKVLIAAVQTQIQQQHDLTTQSSSMTGQLLSLHQTIHNLEERLPRSSLSPADLKPMEGHLLRLSTQVSPAPKVWRSWVGGTAVLTIVLVLYTALVLQPTYLTLQQTLHKQQRTMHQLFICTVAPTNALCENLRRAILEGNQQAP